MYLSLLHLANQERLRVFSHGNAPFLYEGDEWVYEFCTFQFRLVQGVDVLE